MHACLWVSRILSFGRTDSTHVIRRKQEDEFHDQGVENSGSASGVFFEFLDSELHS